MGPHPSTACSTTMWYQDAPAHTSHQTHDRLLAGQVFHENNEELPSYCLAAFQTPSASSLYPSRLSAELYRYSEENVPPASCPTPDPPTNQGYPGETRRSMLPFLASGQDISTGLDQSSSIIGSSGCVQGGLRPARHPA